MQATIESRGRREPAADPERRRRQELALFLKSCRARIRPAEVGLSSAPRRRAPGLLRDEVAQLAGISITWYTWLEQAREANPSPRVLDDLARVLRLDAAERRHLMALARPDLAPSAPVAEAVPAPLAQIVDGLAPHPAYVVNTQWDVLAWNAPAATLLGDFAAHAPDQRNLIALMFCAPAWRTLFVDWRLVAELAVAQFRADTARLVGDPGFDHRIKALCAASPAFAALWRRPEVRPAATWEKTLAHPRGGRLVFDYASLPVDGAGLRLTVYTPRRDDGSAARFAQLLDPRRDSVVTDRRRHPAS